MSAIARRGGADLETLIRLELAVSEAATNVVLHAYRAPRAGGLIHVQACADSGILAVSVRDNGGGLAPRTDSPGMGLGLSLMASESDHFEVSCADGGGTEVRMRFFLRPEASAPPRRRIERGDAAGGVRATA